MFTPRPFVLALSTLLSPLAIATDVILFDNGPFVTDPTGGTSSIAGQPISQAETFPGSTQGSIGFAATVATGTAAADNFVVPIGSQWDLNSVTLFAYQTAQTSPTITQIHINLWTAAPYSAGSPSPVPDPLPQPLLAEALVLPAGTGTFIAHRNSATSTSTSRPVFAYTVSLDALPSAGVLAPGEYWLEWSFVGASSPSQNVFMPLVTPRDRAFDHNARLLNSISGSSADPRVWFEGREGYIAGVSDGRAYALPFILRGTTTSIASCPADLDDDGIFSNAGHPDGGVSIDDLLFFLAGFEGGSILVDLDDDGNPAQAHPDGAVTVDDLLFYLAHFEAGC